MSVEQVRQQAKSWNQQTLHSEGKSHLKNADRDLIGLEKGLREVLGAYGAGIMGDLLVVVGLLIL